MPKRNIDIYEVDNGYEIGIRISGDGNELYDENSVHTKLVATSKEQVAEIFAKFMNGDTEFQLGKDPNETTLGERRLDKQAIPPGQGLHMSSGAIR